MKRLNGKTAIVTGAGRGLGREMAIAFAREGARIGILEIDPKSAASTAAEIADLGGEAEVRIADISDRSAAFAAIDAVAARFGRLDVLVNNAMWIRYEPIDQIQNDTVERMLGIGFKATVWCMQAAVPHMKSNGGGAIINVSSPAAEVGLPNAMIYCGIKGAVLAMTRAAAVELGPAGIRVTAIAPGPIHTAGADTIVDPKGFEMRVRRTPLGRLGTPPDIAKAAIFLASDDAAFVTGDMLHVDGGATFAFL